MRNALILCIAVTSLMACSDAGFKLGTTSEDGSIDSVSDSSTDDTSSMDSTVVDSSEDTIVVDSAHDTKHDTGVKLDTGVVMDTGMVTLDTGTVMDTGTVWTDTGGGTCPMPPTKATFDASSLTCSDLPPKYDSAIAAAKACSCDADCSQSVAKNFCGCTTFVNPGTDAYAELGPMRDRWKALGCTIACPLIPCAVSTTAKCVATSTGAKVCQDS